MNWVEIITETIAGTTLMTLFSLVAGESFRKLFSEPAMLNYVIAISKIRLTPRLNSLLGWTLHYLFGLCFVVPYHLIWKYGWLSPDWVSAAILGAVSGIAGVLGWMLIFRLPRKEPKVAFDKYYLQLFFAHIVFAFTVVAVHKLWPDA